MCVCVCACACVRVCVCQNESANGSDECHNTIEALFEAAYTQNGSYLHRLQLFTQLFDRLSLSHDHSHGKKQMVVHSFWDFKFGLLVVLGWCSAFLCTR